MLSFRKVADRVSDDSSDNNCLDRMELTHSRIWMRYITRAIQGIKANHKRSWKKVTIKFLKLKNILKSVGDYLGRWGTWRWIRKEARSTF